MHSTLICRSLGDNAIKHKASERVTSTTQHHEVHHSQARSRVRHVGHLLLLGLRQRQRGSGCRSISISSWIKRFPPMKTRPQSKSSSISLISTGPTTLTICGKVTRKTWNGHAKELILALVAAAPHLEMFAHLLIIPLKSLVLVLVFAAITHMISRCDRVWCSSREQSRR